MLGCPFNGRKAEKLVTAKFAKNGRQGRKENACSSGRLPLPRSLARQYLLPANDVLLSFFAIFAFPLRSSRLKASALEGVP
jgi:hypothetical protein